MQSIIVPGRMRIWCERTGTMSLGRYSLRCVTAWAGVLGLVASVHGSRGRTGGYNHWDRGACID